MNLNYIISRELSAQVDMYLKSKSRNLALNGLTQ